MRAEPPSGPTEPSAAPAKAAAVSGRHERLVLAVDLGTTAVKVGLVTFGGQVLWWTQAPITTVRDGMGAASQDPDEWWRLIGSAVRRGLADTATEGDAVAALAVTGEWGSTVPVDQDGRPVGPCVLYGDTRGARHAREIFGGHMQGYAARKLATWLRRSGGIPSPSGTDPVGHMLYLSRERPEVARAARWYLETVDYLTMRLTGIATASPASMTAAWLTDNRRLDHADYDPELVALSRVDADKLPPLVATGSVIGPVQGRVAAELGISSRAQVVTGIPDLHSTAIGAGCVRDYDGLLVIGTTDWVTCPYPGKKTDLLRQSAAVPGLSSKGYLIANNQDAAGRCLEWFRDQVLGTLPGGECWTYEQVTDLAATAPPGSGGVLFAPWLVGERSPVDDRSARGGFHNLSVTTNAADLARAVLEGVAFNARWLLSGVEHLTRRRLEPIRLAGGGAQSDLWCQIMADVLDRRVERVGDPVLASLRGAALLGVMALAELSWDEVRDLAPVDRLFAPTPANRDVYDHLFAEFPGLYKSQKGMFRRLNRR
ncbi:MAG TPA: FGGY-family carbohydrate kinase [Nocardioidaceae bacterium]|nr:FGGY-family carbohydrate kinase [Nocardioidaceae bacterium]